jgi:membrane associated rhomboid family serine protease
MNWAFEPSNPVALPPPACRSIRGGQWDLQVKSSEPIFNVPPVVIGTIAALAVVQIGREFLLSPDGDLEFLLWFAFIPARYAASLVQIETFPGGLAADVWTFVSYALIHGNWVHLVVNAVWLLPFGTVVARRFGGPRYLVFFAITAAAGAAAHLLTNWGAILPMVGASAAISGFMAAASRFAFQPGGPLDSWRHHDPESYLIPAAPLAAVLRNPRVFAFVGVWFGLNLLFGIGAGAIPGSDEAVAWQAHIGGFVAGLVLFPLFDPIRPAA